MAQLVEHILGKDEVPSSNLGSSSRKKPNANALGFFQRNPPLRVDEIVSDDEIYFVDEIRLDGGWVDFISSKA